MTTRLKRTYAKPLNTSPPTTRDGFSIVFGRRENVYGMRHRGGGEQQQTQAPAEQGGRRKGRQRSPGQQPLADGKEKTIKYGMVHHSYESWRMKKAQAHNPARLTERKHPTTIQRDGLAPSTGVGTRAASPQWILLIVTR